MSSERKVWFTLLALVALSAASLQAAVVKEMNIDEISGLAANAFRGELVAAEETTVNVGGGELPAVIYTFKVIEGFKGNFTEKDGETYAEIRMLGQIKPSVNGDFQRFSVLPDMPRFQVGQQYVLLTTAPSAVGLSVPVGLAQGAYGIYSDGKVEFAANGAGNTMTYSALVAEIQAALGQ